MPRKKTIYARSVWNYIPVGVVGKLKKIDSEGNALFGRRTATSDTSWRVWDVKVVAKYWGKK